MYVCMHACMHACIGTCTSGSRSHTRSNRSGSRAESCCRRRRQTPPRPPPRPTRQLAWRRSSHCRSLTNARLRAGSYAHQCTHARALPAWGQFRGGAAARTRGGAAARRGNVHPRTVAVVARARRVGLVVAATVQCAPAPGRAATKFPAAPAGACGGPRRPPRLACGAPRRFDGRLLRRIDVGARGRAGRRAPCRCLG